MSIKQQLEAIGKDLAEKTSFKLSDKISFQVIDPLVLQLTKGDECLEFYIASSHINGSEREFILRSDDLANHHYTELSISVVVKEEEVDYLDYPPYDKIAKHFE